MMHTRFYYTYYYLCILCAFVYHYSGYIVWDMGQFMAWPKVLMFREEGVYLFS